MCGVYAFLYPYVLLCNVKTRNNVQINYIHSKVDGSQATYEELRDTQRSELCTYVKNKQQCKLGSKKSYSSHDMILLQ